jgi:hypothetical protein
VDGRDERGHDEGERLPRKPFPQASWPDLFPAIHVFPLLKRREQDVDGRDKRG